MDQAKGRLSLLVSLSLFLKFETFFEKKLLFMTRIPQPPSLGFKSVDLELRVQVIIACPLQSL